jgi:thiol-disulfide isomerase/thioredoxin
VGHAAQTTVVVWMASWCGHCRTELGVFDSIRAHHPDVRWLAANYKAHEEYDQRGNSDAIRELAQSVAWMRIVPAGDALFTAFGSPPLIPTIFIYDRNGTEVAHFDRRERKPPEAAELDALLARLP